MGPPKAGLAAQTYNNSLFFADKFTMRIFFTFLALICFFNISYSRDDDITHLNRAVSDDPCEFAIVEKLVEQYINQQNFISADSVLKQYTSCGEKNAYAVYLEARILDLTENIEKAMSKYWEAIDLDSTLWPAYRDLAFLYDIFSGYETMNRLLRKALIFAPIPESLYYDYGYTFDMIGQLDSARYYYQNAILFDSLDYQAYLNLGAIIALGGNLDSAKYLSEKAIEINPESPEALFNLGEINLSLGLFNQAAGSFQQALALDPALFAAKKRLGDLYEIMGDSGMARVYFEDFLKSAPIIYIDDIKEVRDKLDQYK